MTESTETSFDEIKKDFLGFLKFTKGYSETTCYGYSSDLAAGTVANVGE